VAELNQPGCTRLDAAGNLVVTDTGNGRIRVVADNTGTFYGQAMTAGNIYTVAGNGRAEFAGDGGPAIAAAFLRPSDVTVDPSGDLLITDQFASRIRMVAP
jgi:hypothetical protein